MATITETQRASYRAAVEFPVLYVVDGRAGTRTGTASGLAAGGLRVVSDEDLPEGTLLELRFTLPNDVIHDVHVEKEIVSVTPRGRSVKKIMGPPDHFEPMTVRAKVLLAYFNVRRRKLSHSVQFVDITERTQEEIQRFIHVWQLHVIRERAQMRGE
ncbi:MAG TPA: PilZ domain-containing protein [Candidatus Elarobacter sp.]|nr:PilZ domain-containing protein [Candidatus Elarobacter sp.]